jgi:hypothetical protein
MFTGRTIRVDFDSQPDLHPDPLKVNDHIRSLVRWTLRPGFAVAVVG